MKKAIAILSLIAVIGAVLVIPNIAYAINNGLVFESGITERDNVEKIRSVSLLSAENKQITVTYENTRTVSEGMADIYKDDKGNDYIFKNGKLAGFYSNEIDKPLVDCKPIGDAAATKIAAAFLADFTDNVEEYELQSFIDKENYGQYYITFARKIGDIYTNESAKVSVMYDGAVKSVAVYNDGDYDGVSADMVDGITETTLLAYAQAEMDLIYPNADGEFELTEYCLAHDSNGYYIEIYGNMLGSSESVRYYLED